VSSHSYAAVDTGRAFAVGVALNLAFVLTKAAMEVIAGSVALLADAGHNLSDVLGLLLAWGASVLARRLPSERRTYGLRRSTTLAALLNALLLLVAFGALAWEAMRRFGQAHPVAGEVVIWTAAVGIAINTATALLFRRGRERDLNVRGAFLHMAADAGVSLGVVLAGVAIVLTGRPWIDPLVTLAIVAVILVGTWGLLRDSVNLALDAVPRGVDLPGVRSYLDSLPGVTEVHDLHIWGMSTTEAVLTAHLVRPGWGTDDAFLQETARAMHVRFGIEHATLQVETGSQAHPCGLAPNERV